MYKMDNYGFHALCTGVFNFDKGDYHIGVQFNDTEQNKFDDNFKGKIDNIENDIVKVILEYYLRSFNSVDSTKKHEEALKASKDGARPSYFDSIDKDFESQLDKFDKKNVHANKQDTKPHDDTLPKKIDDIFDSFHYYFPYF